jgi:hypothetical protein
MFVLPVVLAFGLMLMLAGCWCGCCCCRIERGIVMKMNIDPEMMKRWHDEMMKVSVI